MKEKLIFMRNFIKNPIQNASFIPSSKHLAKNMIKGINFDKINNIVELGPGIGSFTNEIIINKKNESKFIAIELNNTYAKMLSNKYNEKIIVENCSAHLLDDIMKLHNIDKIDLIISGLGFVSLPENILNPLLTQIKKHTTKGTIFRTFTYMPKIFEHKFNGFNIEKKSFTLFNFPPAYVYGIN